MLNTALNKIKAVFSLLFHYIHKKFLWGMLSSVDEKFLKFLFVGLLNSVFAYSLYVILVAIGLIPNVALFFQYIIGTLWNFKTTGIIVFKNHNNRLIFKFVGSYVFTFILNSILLNILIRYINEYLAQAILIPFIAVISFMIFRLYVFCDKK